MIRLIIASVLIFLIEVVLFCTFTPAILNHFSGIDIKLLTFTAKQRRVVHNIQRQNEVNLQNAPAIFVLGGSTSREFFFEDARMSQMTGRPFVNLGASSQTLIDSLRLADNVENKNATVLYCLYPMKFMRFSQRVPAESRYLMGAYLKYPITSSAVDNLLADVAPHNMATSLIAELNVFCYLLKNYFLEKNIKLQQMLAGIQSISVGELLIDNRPPIQHFYHQRAYDRNRLRFELLKIKKKIGSSLEANLEANFELLAQLVNLVHKRGQEIILFELPYSYTFERMFQRELSVYRNHLDVFLQDRDLVHFKRIEFDVYQGQEALFYDHGHLLDSGRQYFYPRVERIFGKDLKLAANH
jgi:hypothetical protein